MPACGSYGADRELDNITVSEGKIIMSSKWRKLILKIILVWIICTVDILWSVRFIYSWRQNGTIIPVRNASTDLGGIFRQNIMVSAIAIFLFLLTLICLREQFTEAMYMKISGKRQRNASFICLGVLTVMTFAALVAKEDKITVLYSLLYYTVFDILDCPYCKYLNELGCPELKEGFCKSDEYIYGNLERFSFERSQTLASGGNKCDFGIRRK